MPLFNGRTGRLGRADGQSVRMKIELHDASLFGFRFVTVEPSGKPAAGTFRLWQLASR